LSDHQRDLVRTVRESAATLLALIDDILDFSKIEAGRLEIELAPVSVVDLVEGLCNSLAPVATRRGVQLRSFISPDVPDQVMTDDVRLRQIIYNLVGNAIKFSSGRPEQRGHVSIRVELAEREALLLSFRITDDGIGMKPETVRALFTPFTQAEVATTRLFGGTGLGLAICKRLVDLLKGEIAVASEPGKGSVFTVQLPLAAAPPLPKQAKFDLVGVICIVVLGDSFAAEDLAIYLRHAGAAVAIAKDKQDAVARLPAAQACVVIHDVGEQGVTVATLNSIFGKAENIRHLLIARGLRRLTRINAPNVVTIDGSALRRQALLRAVAVAAGRASPEVFRDPGWQDDFETATAAPSVTEARALGKLLLIAEDDEISQKVILQQLALLGYAAEVANNGVEALRMWRAGSYALLLTDLHMPELDGYTLAQTIRQEEGGQRRMPIMALTANALRGDASRAQVAGMDEYLTKPVQLKFLRAALEKWLPGSSRQDPPANLANKASGNAGPEVNVEVLRGLIGKEEEVVRSFLAEYLQLARRLAGELRDASRAKDARRVAAIAHKLKSSSRSIGAIVLGDLCAELENAGKAENVWDIVKAIGPFDAAMDSVEFWIEKYLG